MHRSATNRKRQHHDGQKSGIKRRRGKSLNDWAIAMYRIKKKSGWNWRTSGGVSAAYGIMGAGKGHFVLTDPNGRDVTFNYASIGAGLNVRGKVSLGGSTEDNFSFGLLYLLDTFPGDELTSHDIEGFCLIDELSVADMIGYRCYYKIRIIGLGGVSTGKIFSRRLALPTLAWTPGTQLPSSLTFWLVADFERRPNSAPARHGFERGLK
jgi:hypothetical protein